MTSMVDTTLVERNTPVANDVATDVADELAPEIARATNPISADTAERAQLEAEVDKRVKEHVDSLPAEKLTQLGEEIAQSTSTDPKAREMLDAQQRSLKENSQTLKEVLFSALTGKDKTGMQRLEDLSPEEREKAEENLRKLLEGSTDEELVRLFDKVGVKTGSPTETRQEIIDALMKSQLLERSVSDPAVAANLSESLVNSGKLSSELSNSLREVIGKTREALEKIKEVVEKEIEKRILRFVEKAARLPAARGQGVDYSPAVDSKIDFPFYVEFLQALNDSDALKPFDPTQRKDDEVQRGLTAIGEALREREEKAAQKESERRDVEDDLRREIQRIARQNPGLFNSLVGLAVSQHQYLDPMVVGIRTQPYESAFD